MNKIIFLLIDFDNVFKKQISSYTIPEFHEAMHAYIQYVFKQYQLGVITDSNVVKSQFPIFWGNVGNISTPIQDHNVIANNWVNTIASSLNAFSNSPGLSTQMRDSAYRSLAWGGLGETDVFKQHPGKCNIIAINHVGRYKSLPAPFQVSGLLPAFSNCQGTYNFSSSTFKLRSPCD